jgi:hypothetical protein
MDDMKSIQRQETFEAEEDKKRKESLSYHREVFRLLGIAASGLTPNKQPQSEAANDIVGSHHHHSNLPQYPPSTYIFPEPEKSGQRRHERRRNSIESIECRRGGTCKTYQRRIAELEKWKAERETEAKVNKEVDKNLKRIMAEQRKQLQVDAAVYWQPRPFDEGYRNYSPCT